MVREARRNKKISSFNFIYESLLEFKYYLYWDTAH